MRLRLLIALALLALAAPLAPHARAARAQSADDGRAVADFLAAQPGVLQAYTEGDQTAAMLIVSQADYYGLSPRLYLAMLEATSGLLSDPAPPADALARPFGAAGPQGFGAQIDWASRELRAGLGPYDAPPTLRFSDGSTLTITLQQAPEGVAVQRFLAQGRSQTEWRQVVTRFNEAFQRYFNNQLPAPGPQGAAGAPGFLMLPWPKGTRVSHLAFFDHAYPTVDSGDDGNSIVVDYLGRGNQQYDGHDGHDFVFLDQPIGTPILAAAPGVAYARTLRGNGVVILHDGGYETVYWHLDQFAPLFNGRLNTDRGVRVNAGDLIGTSGRSGFVGGTPHLHFEVRLRGRQIDPYGWYGPGPDPCLRYSGCTQSAWLWHPSLRGSYDFTPPDAPAPIVPGDPPLATLTAQPRPDLRFLARFDGNPLQQVGSGFPETQGTLRYGPARVGQGVSVPADSSLSYAVEGNLSPQAGTLSFWALLPATYPAANEGRSELFATSASAAAEEQLTGTPALRHEESGGARQWNFWTLDDAGVRNDLRAPDGLAPGLHHIALTWDAATGSKVLYLDGRKAAEQRDVLLPKALGQRFLLGQLRPGFGTSDVTLDELAIFGRALDAPEVAALAASSGPLAASSGVLRSGQLQVDVNALSQDGIVAVQLGIDGRWEAPQPYYDSYRWSVPPLSGTVTLGARFFDRANQSATISTTLRIAPQSIFLPLTTAPSADTRRQNRSAPQGFIPLVLH